MASTFDLEKSFSRAAKRFADTKPPARKSRSDRGALRISADVVRLLEMVVSDMDYPGMTELMARLCRGCQQSGLDAPSRATVYKLLRRVDGPAYRLSSLPKDVQDALYNLGPDNLVPAAQVVFYCFNYGNLRAVQWAATLPWLALYQARRMRGWRSKSRGLLLAAARARGVG
jgi:hypothetical protein